MGIHGAELVANNAAKIAIAVCFLIFILLSFSSAYHLPFKCIAALDYNT